MDMEGFIFRRESACACIARLGVAGVTPSFLVSTLAGVTAVSQCHKRLQIAVHSPQTGPGRF